MKKPPAKKKKKPAPEMPMAARFPTKIEKKKGRTRKPVRA